MHEQPSGETRLIPLRRVDGTIRAHAIVDAADYEWLMQWRWCMNSNGYAVRNVTGGKMIRMHRQILGLQPGDPRQGDHRNRDRLDCRRENLRIAERAEKDNGQNQPSKAGTSRYRGVYWNAQFQKWEAQARLNYKKHFLGRFDDEAEAAAAAAAFRAKHMPFSEEGP